MPDFECVANPIACSAETLLRGALGQFVEMLKQAAEWMVALAFGWWIEVDSVVPTVANTPVRGELAWFAFAVVVAGLMMAGIKIIMVRRADPAVDAVKGLAIVAMVSATGLTMVRMTVQAGDAWAAQLLAAGVDGVGDEIITALSLSSVSSPGVVFIMAIVVFVLSLAQAVLMLFREGAILILTGMLPLAAAGQLTGIGRQWFPKVTGWLLALVCYKPVAALAYFTVFRGLDTADSGRELLIAVVMLGLAVAALPALMKFFSWVSGSVSTGTGGGGGLGLAAGAAGAAVMASAARPSSYGAAATGPAMTRTEMINRSLGPADGSATRPTGASPISATGRSAFAASGASRAHVAAAAVDVAARAGQVVRSAAVDAATGEGERT